MKTERHRTATDLPVSLMEAKEHFRVTHSFDDASITGMIYAAALEIEELSGLALLPQIVTVTTGADIGATIALPVGPTAPDDAVTINGTVVSVDDDPLTLGYSLTVATLGTDGTATPVASDRYWFQPGRWPVLHITDPTLTGPLLITYQAATAATPAGLPYDLRLAICDQAVRHYGIRGDDLEQPVALSPLTARVIARHGRVRL